MLTIIDDESLVLSHSRDAAEISKERFNRSYEFRACYRNEHDYFSSTAFTDPEHRCIRMYRVSDLISNYSALRKKDLISILRAHGVGALSTASCHESLAELKDGLLRHEPHCSIKCDASDFLYVFTCLYK